MKKERLTKSDEQRERQMINEQIGKAAAEQEEQGSSGTDEAENSPPAELLQRPEGEPVKISLSLNKPAASEPSSATSAAPSTSGLSIKLGSSSSASTTKLTLTNSLRPAINPLKTNPLKVAAAPKLGNVFKSAVAPVPAPVAGTKREREPLSVAESLMMEDMARKRRRMDQEGVRA
jgi:DNA/RNA-binding protein KIN17